MLTPSFQGCLSWPRKCSSHWPPTTLCQPLHYFLSPMLVTWPSPRQGRTVPHSPVSSHQPLVKCLTFRVGRERLTAGSSQGRAYSSIIMYSLLYSFLCEQLQPCFSPPFIFSTQQIFAECVNTDSGNPKSKTVCLPFFIMNIVC